MEGALIEIIKYGTKTLPNLEDQRKKIGKGPNVYLAAQYNIYEAMKGLRIFERFGFNREKDNNVAPGQRVVTDFNEWLFLSEAYDWHHNENELVLSGYNPSSKLLEILSHEVDFKSE